MFYFCKFFAKEFCWRSSKENTFKDKHYHQLSVPLPGKFLKASTPESRLYVLLCKFALLRAKNTRNLTSFSKPFSGLSVPGSQVLNWIMNFVILYGNKVWVYPTYHASDLYNQSQQTIPKHSWNCPETWRHYWTNILIDGSVSHLLPMQLCHYVLSNEVPQCSCLEQQSLAN